MDDFFAINAAKTEFRECFNLGDASRVLAIADPDLVSFSDGQPSEFGTSGLEALKTRLTNLFERFTAKLSVIVIEIRLQGDVAYDYGWHDLTLTPKDGESIRRRYRYVDIWRRNKKGNWKLQQLSIPGASLRTAVARSSAEIAMWIFGGETRKATGSSGCIWITRTSLIRSQSELLRRRYKFTEDFESFCAAAC
jgi:ketosteroid isomerase-like protein